MTKTTSEEFNQHAKDAAIVYMPELDRNKMGGTMRLGLRKTIFQDGSEWSRLRSLYGSVSVIEERHRHRYEVNPEFVNRLTDAGMDFIGKDETGERMEIFELRSHPYFVGTQFHAEYQSRVLDPSVSLRRCHFTHHGAESTDRSKETVSRIHSSQCRLLE